jgi:hypothetical protein
VDERDDSPVFDGSRQYFDTSPHSGLSPPS